MGKIFKALEKSEQHIHDGEEPVIGSSHEEPDVTESVSANGLVDEVETDGDHEANETTDHQIREIESIPVDLNPALITLLKPYSPAAEQFRLLKTNILFPENGEPARTIMITSPSPHEGKSFVSANLAISMAQSIDEYVLLMDCDLRSPTVHSLFGLEGRKIKGLSDYLSAGASLSSVMHKTFVSKLTILPGGPVPSNPSELLSSEQMRRMLHEVKLRYSDRYIIIDTPPPYITSETNAIARYVDGIVIVVRHGKTRIKEVQDIVDIYGREKILGVITNFSKKTIGYGYGYKKYGYGYTQ